MAVEGFTARLESLVRGTPAIFGRTLRLLWLALLLGYVAWKLSQLGWREVIVELPRSPWFFLIFAISFLVLPASERWIYRLIWGHRIGLAPFIRKRALNNVVVGYSGDAYFYLWARVHLKLPDRRLFAGIKDSGILSGIAGTIATIALVIGTIAIGRGALIERMVAGQTVAGLAIGIAAVLIIPLAWRLRRKVFWISPEVAGEVFAIHLARVLIVLTLQVLQWWAALPIAPLSTWLLFVTAQQVIGQLPLAPNRDLLVLAVSLELTGSGGVPADALSGVLVGTALLRQITNLAALVLTGFARAPAGALDSDRASGDGMGDTAEESVMADVDGSWNTVVESPMGNQEATLTIASDGGSFSGQYAGALGTMPIKDGKVAGNQLDWSIDMTVPMPMTLTCTATVEGDELKGTVTAGGFGSFPMTGVRLDKTPG